MSLLANPRLDMSAILMQILGKRLFEMNNVKFKLCYILRFSRQSLPLSGLSNAQLAEHYADCIKLSTENVSVIYRFAVDVCDHD
jgi:hypothetical protein